MPDWRDFIRQRLAGLSVGPVRESEIVSELALQMEQAYTEALAVGAGEDEAVRRAEAQFSDWRRLTSDINTAEAPVRSRLFGGAGHDLRYTVRVLRRNPLFAAIAVGTLAFAIGGNTAVFTLVDAISLRPLPYSDPARLMAIETHEARQPEIESWTSAADFFDLRSRTRSFSSMAGISPLWYDTLSTSEGAEQLRSLYVSASFFPMLGVRAAQGRTFSADEDRPQVASNVVVLSHEFWLRRLGGRPVIGKTLVINYADATVIGILPRGFHYAGEPLAGTADDADAWFPLASNQLTNALRGVRFLKVIGRLQPGVSKDLARDDIARTGKWLESEYPASNRGYVMDVKPLETLVQGRFRLASLLLLGSIGFVLLMACANVVNLLLARAAVRQREIPVRAALGASRLRLARQLLLEGAVLAAAGGVAGLAFAYAALKGLVAAAPASVIQGRTIVLDSRALLFTGAVALVCALLAGFPPAWRLAFAEIADLLREGGRGVTAGNHRLRSALVVVQVSVAVFLLVGAALLIRSFQHLLDINPGFDAGRLVTISIQVPGSAPKPAERIATYKLVHDALCAVPGVTSVDAVSRLPLAGMNLGVFLFMEGKSIPGQTGPDVEYRRATPGYFATMGIPLRRGRWFDDRDDANHDPVALINDSMARKFWPGEDAVGKRIKLGPTPERSPWTTIVGVVGDVRHFGLDADPRPEVYSPYALSPLFAPILVIRTAGDPSAMVGTLRSALRAADPAIAAYNIYPVEDLVVRSTIQRRFLMLLLAGFALAAMLLAAIGIYGTVSQSVAQRTREIGVRMALGASPREAVGLVLRDGLRLVLTGLAAGLLSAAALTRLITKLLFEVRPLDPLAFAGAAVVIFGCALLACYIPARRVTRVDPLEVLRYE